MFTPSPKAPSSPTSAAVEDGDLGQHSECVPKKHGASPMLAIQWEISRAHCRVSLGRSRPRRPSKRNSPGLLLAAAI